MHASVQSFPSQPGMEMERQRLKWSMGNERTGQVYVSADGAPSKFLPPRRTHRLTDPWSKRGRFKNFVSTMQITRSFSERFSLHEASTSWRSGVCLESFNILGRTRHGGAFLT